MNVTSWFPTVIHCKHKVIYYGKMRLAPAQTHYKLKRANRVNEAEMRKACVPKIAWEEGILWEGCGWPTDEIEGVLMYLIKHSSSLVKAPNLQIRETLSCCPWGSPYSKTVRLVPGGGIKELRNFPQLCGSRCGVMTDWLSSTLEAKTLNLDTCKRHRLSARVFFFPWICLALNKMLC